MINYHYNFINRKKNKLIEDKTLKNLIYEDITNMIIYRLKQYTYQKISSSKTMNTLHKKKIIEEE